MTLCRAVLRQHAAPVACRERDVHEAVAQAAQAQAQLLQEAEGAAEARAQELTAECQRLQVACASRESEQEQLQAELRGLAASEAAARKQLEAAAGAASEQAAALNRAQRKLEVARAQLQAQSAASEGSGRWVVVRFGVCTQRRSRSSVRANQTAGRPACLFPAAHPRRLASEASSRLWRPAAPPSASSWST